MFRRFFSRRFAEASNYYRAGPRESVESRAQRFGTYSFFRNKRVIDLSENPRAKSALEEALKGSMEKAVKELQELGVEDDCGLMKGSLSHDAGFVGRVFQRLGLLPSNINLRLMTPNDFMRMMRLRAMEGEPPTGTDLGKAYFVREANYEFFADYTLKNFKIEWENLKVDDRSFSSRNSSAVRSKLVD
ncbi:hypothetical protein Pmar_PMAR004195 [Perkinsus marinus ATCC 50983]|uniref:Uncharacterized protein n=1 Tax=Perkinsus marinus (strain ATCC 50983 / TXsc) TaxID=423536 RepID=C5LPK2_PERM5|nr:hypothetical protein Pmar_PMAR004195 [Perkinsus marinus ATCC 50983]EER01322.1 hypothetical protein Pmar_PMAR004195 [Perkinsus marinus ATCC 50983]|eukprot:XP_002768604.1 hypothetical protein Pmar_PMAR004195 [Perkinsus marinus ATCC 50983]